MTFRGQVAKGQILLDHPVQLPEGTAVNVEITPRDGSLEVHARQPKPEKFEPIRLPGPSLADELVRDRR
jgi:hypothetical protein